jgi:hypothetical protein
LTALAMPGGQMSSDGEESNQQGEQVIVTPEAIQDVCEWLDLKMGSGR